MDSNTILITGGTSGIGFELAKQFLALGNTVLITGRDGGKLEQSKKRLPGVHVFQSDASDPEAIALLYEKITKAFPDLNVIVNNAGIMKKIDMQGDCTDLVNITREIEINLMGPIWMVKQFLDHLKTKKTAAILNISSGLAFVPLPISPVYCATKAGIHSFTQSLRIQLDNTNIEVFELAPPGTDTPLLSGDGANADMGGPKPMAVNVLVKCAIEGLRKGIHEIRPGLSDALKLMSRLAPQLILKQMGKSVETMRAQTKSET
jgi:uncharacterized oxidoreductase